MTEPLAHESPIYIVLPPRQRAGDALKAILSRPEVRQYHLPAPWCLDLAGIEPLAGAREARTLTLENLPWAVEAAIEQATSELLDRLATFTWQQADEEVRRHFAARTIGQSIAAIFRAGPRTREIDPPAAFVAERVFDHAIEVEYRLEPAEGYRTPLAPASEGTIALYPFDPTNREARRELGLAEGPETILEGFAYASGREAHLAFLRDAGRSLGFRVETP